MTVTVIKIHQSNSTAIYCLLRFSTMRGEHIFCCAMEELEQEEITLSNGVIKVEQLSFNGVVLNRLQ